MLLYDSINPSGEGLRMMMATWLLEGLEKGLGFFPELTGAGLSGDHVYTQTAQFTGEGMSMHNAMALVFGDGIHIDSVVLHGCRPGSAYYTVTKADGSVILEINNTPAIKFMDGVLGSGITPEQYPFFLLFGLNRGTDGIRVSDEGYVIDTPSISGEGHEDNYVGRLCMGLDYERGGLVMSQPDMVEGTEFQLMYRSFDLEYMKPKIDSLFEQLDGREPVFGMYIDCAGRCSGYGGVDKEDARILQGIIDDQVIIVGKKVPILGIYSSAEIAPVAGRPDALAWTGVFCLFSKNGRKDSEQWTENREQIESTGDRGQGIGNKGQRGKTEKRRSQDVSVGAALKLSEQNMARVLALDAQSVALRYELELKRRGFQLIYELAISLRETTDQGKMFFYVAQRINGTLNMQKTIVFLPIGDGMLAPLVMKGFTPEEENFMADRTVEAPRDLLSHNPVIVTAEDPPGRFAEIREEFELPYFIASPVVLQNELAAILMTGRMVEQPPYFGRLGHGDLETLHAITELLSSILVRLHLRDVSRKAETDGLTELWNRNAFKRKVDECLKKYDNTGAFIIIDIDFFKEVNDTYGHVSGDNVLKDCAKAMKGVFRESDIIARHGGDEFAVFCPGIKSGDVAERKAAQIQEAFKSVRPEEGAKYTTASIGIALAPQHGTKFHELYLNADESLYKAKERGRNCYVL